MIFWNGSKFLNQIKIDLSISDVKIVIGDTSVVHRIGSGRDFIIICCLLMLNKHMFKFRYDLIIMILIHLNNFNWIVVQLFGVCGVDLFVILSEVGLG